jgi:hypothetical protein
MPINEDKLCVLKRNALNGQILLAYETINIQLNEYLDELYAFIEDKENTGNDIFNYLLDHSILKLILKTYNFCTNLSDTTWYQQRDINSQIVYYNLEETKQLFNNPNYTKSHLLKLCKRRILAHSLENAYDTCSSNSEILAFSHRKVGWSQRPYKLDENFSIEFKTNFGYGRKSYFFTKLKYKEIDIVPISEWIFYRNAELYEIIEASAKHTLDNESWKQAMEYGEKACNLFLRNETEFVNQYLKQECEKLISGLSDIKLYSKFKLLKNENRFNPSFEEIQMAGSELIAFRGKKISGALYFIDNIKCLKTVFTVINYIKTIENFNKDIHPILVNEFKRILDLLPQLNTQLLTLQVSNEKLKEKDSDYDKNRSAIKELLQESEEYEVKNYSDKREYLNAKFLEKYPEYNSFQRNLEHAKEKYYALYDKIDSLKNDLRSIEESIEKIDKYFEVSV